MMEYHRYADLFPMMNTNEMRALCEDMAAHGYDTSAPIMLYGGAILDGRNRQVAADTVGVAPCYTTFEGEDQAALDYVIRHNLHRRHLSETQRAVISGRLETMKRGRPSEKDANLHLISRDEAAAMLNVSPRTVATVKQIERKAPELMEKLESGEMTAYEAITTIKKEERKQANADKHSRPIPEGKYKVIYADPPWQYDNSGFDEAAESQYPTMPVDDICALNISALADDATVLFLWATNPLLIEAIQVMKAWGFEYKTNIAWVKDQGRGKGWFLKSKHELLLIGVMKNTPHPLIRPDSAQEADRGNVHSKKPELFYELIEAMYPGSKIELFARNTRPGWDSWGNEV